MAGTSYDIVFYHQFLDRHPMWPSQSKAEADIDPRQMVAIATDVAHRRAPSGQPVLVTNGGAAFAGRPHLAIEHRELNDPAFLQYDRIRCYRDYIAARVGGNDRLGAIFLDTDALALREMAPLFDLPFDVAFTYVESAVVPPPPRLDRWGLPDDGRASAINFGVMAARFTDAAIGFFDAVLARFEAMAAEGEEFVAGSRNQFRTADRTTETYFRIADVRTWGGDQFAVISLLSEPLFADFREDCQVVGARVRLLPVDSWNFSPPGGPMRWDMLDDRFVLHLKGNRKKLFYDIAARLA